MKRSALLQTIIIIFIVASFFACSKSGSNPAPKNTGTTLAIASLTISSGPYATEVIITGTGFDATKTNDLVSFNGHAGVVEFASSTQITTSVPLGAGTGKITVSVNGNTATGPVFTYQVEEVVTTFAGGQMAGKANGVGEAATFYQPEDIATDAAGNLYVADAENHMIRKITPDGTVSTLAGSGSAGYAEGTGTAASFNSPSGVVADGAGNIYVVDRGNSRIRKINSSGLVSTIAGNGSNQANDGTGTAASFSDPVGIAIDGNGNLYVADHGEGKIRKITPSGVVTSITGGDDTYYLTLDKTGNIYTAEYSSNVILKITPNGNVSVFAGNGNIIGGALDGKGSSAGFYHPYGIAIDDSGNLFVTDRGNMLIRKISPAGDVTTFAGKAALSYNGPANMATFGIPLGIATDKSGNIFVADGNAIRKIGMQ